MTKSILSFCGGVGSVTGANFLLDTGDTAILIDCGLVQGDRFAMAQNADPFLYNPADIDVLFVTHAHADHIGRIPKLIKDGFVGRIYSTPPTKALADIMLRDAYKIMLSEEERFGAERLYDEEHIDEALSQWHTESYGNKIAVSKEITAQLTNVGHILGSALVTLTRGGRSVVFTGDIETCHSHS